MTGYTGNGYHKCDGNMIYMYTYKSLYYSCASLSSTLFFCSLY